VCSSDLIPCFSEEPLEKADSLYSKGDFSAAASCAEKILKDDPHNVKAGCILADSLCELRKCPKGIEIYRNMIRRDPENMELTYRFGVVLSKAEFYANAVTAFRQVIEKFPDHALAHYRLGRCHASTMDLSAAYDEYRILKKLDKKLADDLLSYIQTNR
jgi:tetratricopeptide (TPR) repeat protein